MSDHLYLKDEEEHLCLTRQDNWTKEEQAAAPEIGSLLSEDGRLIEITDHYRRLKYMNADHLTAKFQLNKTDDHLSRDDSDTNTTNSIIQEIQSKENYLVHSEAPENDYDIKNEHLIKYDEKLEDENSHEDDE